MPLPIGITEKPSSADAGRMIGARSYDGRSAPSGMISSFESSRTESATMISRPNGPIRLTAIRSVNAAVIFRLAHGPATPVKASMMLPTMNAPISAPTTSPATPPRPSRSAIRSGSSTTSLWNGPTISDPPLRGRYRGCPARRSRQGRTRRWTSQVASAGSRNTDSGS